MKSEKKLGDKFLTIQKSEEGVDMPDKVQEEKRYKGFKLSKIVPDDDLAINGWGAWKVRIQLVNTVTIKEAIALSFGINPQTISRLSENTSPSAERYEVRLGTLSIAVRQDKVKSLGHLMDGEKEESRLIEFSGFMAYVKNNEETAVCKELVDLWLEVENQKNVLNPNETKLNKSSNDDWKALVAEQAAVIWSKRRARGENPTKNSIKDELAVACGQQRANVKTGRDINPTAAYIYRHVLSDWTPPDD